MFWETILECKDAIIGVLSTLLGVIVGWLLTELSRKGKLVIRKRDTKRCRFYDEKEFADKYDEKSVKFEYKFELEVCNLSLDRRTMKDLQVVFCGKKNKVKLDADVTKDEQSLVELECKGKIVNLPPRATAILNLEVKRDKNTAVLLKKGKTVPSAREKEMWEETQRKTDLQAIHNSTKLFLLYKNEKNKEKKKLLAKGEIAKNVID